MNDLHDGFAAWLTDGARGDPPRDLALHAAGCEGCLVRAGVLDLLGKVDVGAAPPPPGIVRVGRLARGPLSPVRYAAGAAAALVLASAAVVGATGWLASSPVGVQGPAPTAAATGHVLAGAQAPTPSASANRASESASPSVSPSPTPSPTPQAERAPEATTVPVQTPRPATPAPAPATPAPATPVPSSAAPSPTATQTPVATSGPTTTPTASATASPSPSPDATLSPTESPTPTPGP